MINTIENTLTNEETEYLLSLNDKEKKGYKIAKSHLGSAFRLDKSVGFLQWLETRSLKSS
jgi:hypothetical protein